MWTSTNSGLNWFSNNIPYSPANFARAFLSAASTADGNGLVVGSYGTLIYNSTNAGLTWRTNNVPLATWQSAACSADGTKLIAGTISFGKTYTSTNSGTTWATNNIPSDAWESVASSADGGKMAAVGSYIYTSTNYGITWTSNSAPRASWSGVVMSADGNKLFAVVKNGGGIWTSQATPSPRVSLTPTNGSLNLSWLVPSTNFVMQQSSDLASWSNLTNVSVLNLTNLQNQISLPLSADKSFYRLATP